MWWNNLHSDTLSQNWPRIHRITWPTHVPRTEAISRGYHAKLDFTLDSLTSNQGLRVDGGERESWREGLIIAGKWCWLFHWRSALLQSPVQNTWCVQEPDQTHALLLINKYWLFRYVIRYLVFDWKQLYSDLQWNIRRLKRKLP